MNDVPEQQVYPFKQLDKFQMFTEAPGVPGKRSRLVWVSYRGNPRITVFTNIPNDASKGIINAPMNPETFLVFMDMLESVAKDPNESKFKIDCWTNAKNPNNPDGPRDRILISEVYFGRDDKGIIWISLIAPNRPRIRFSFVVSDFHKIYKGSGEQFTERESSTVQTLAIVRALRGAMNIHMSEIAPPYVPLGQTPASRPNAPAQPAASSAKQFDDIDF